MVTGMKAGPGQVLAHAKGKLTGFVPAIGRPGCILTLSAGGSTGRYYVGASPHDVRQAVDPATGLVRIRIRTWEPQDEDGCFRAELA